MDKRSFQMRSLPPFFPKLPCYYPPLPYWGGGLTSITNCVHILPVITVTLFQGTTISEITSISAKWTLVVYFTYNFRAEIAPHGLCMHVHVCLHTTILYKTTACFGRVLFSPPFPFCDSNLQCPMGCLCLSRWLQYNFRKKTNETWKQQSRSGCRRMGNKGNVLKKRSPAFYLWRAV